MSVKLEKTKTPGVYKRGRSYVVVYRFQGKQRKKCVRSYAEARTLHGKLTSSVAEGTHREASACNRSHRGGGVNQCPIE